VAALVSFERARKYLPASCPYPQCQPGTKYYWSLARLPEKSCPSLILVNPGLRHSKASRTLGHSMKTRILILAFAVAAATPVFAGSLSYAQCGTYDSYLWLYKTTDRFEELGKLRCDEKVEVLDRENGYSQVRTLDGRVGWVRDADLSLTPPSPRQGSAFGLTKLTGDVPPSPVTGHKTSLLTNDDVLLIHAIHPGSDLILNKISSSRCAFDTSPEALRMLTASGLPNKVILAMLQTPVASETSERRAQETIEVRIPDGTAIEVALAGNVSSEEVHEGAVIEMAAAEDLVVNGVPVILRGSPARARIFAFYQPGTRGGSGKVAWLMQDISAIGGAPIAVSFAYKQPHNNRPQTFEGYPVFVSEFRKGDPAVKATGKSLYVVTHGDTVVSVPQPLAADMSAPKSKPQTQSVLQVSSQPAVTPDPPAPPQEPVSDESKP
jgi:hypothetical protein